MSSTQQPTVAGHPAGLFTLFFAEMWERFSYYGMRALLVFYMTKGFLGYGDDVAYKVYGAYTALVYATPFLGGMLADRLLGARRAVVFGGVLMALGHLLMTIEHQVPFFVALALLIVGNGFFKPNISTIVGSLYPAGNPKRDSGFTIFYMGINLGAAMSPLLCGYVGERYGWHYGFGLATAGMLIGLAVFVAPRAVTMMLVALGALGSAGALVMFQNNVYNLAINLFVAFALVAAAATACTALGRGGLPDGAGLPPDPERLRRPLFGPISAEWCVYLGVLLAVPLLSLLVQNSLWAGRVLTLFGGLAFASLIGNAVVSPKVERERLFVVLILMFFSMLFWAFFEQAGSSVNLFTDRNVDRVMEQRQITREEVGQVLEIELSQEQLGHYNGSQLFTMTELDKARAEGKQKVQWQVVESNVGMGVSGSEIPASTFQAANAIFIVSLGLVFTAMWAWMASRKVEPSTPVKFSLGLLQLGLGFVALWVGAQQADARGMVGVTWLLLAYLLHTTGELCLSPVGLSMVTKLSPRRMVSTVMGAWFLATAFSNYLAGIIASFTGVSGEGGKEATIPAPLATLPVYAGVFKIIALTAIGSGVVCLLLAPLLTKWMHRDVIDEEPEEQLDEPGDPGFSPFREGQGQEERD